MRPITLLALSSLIALAPLSLAVAAETPKSRAETPVSLATSWPVRTLSAAEAQADVALMRR
ncbi:MAG: hypothetical protein INF09_07320, partial [Aquidulcibacter sp.]|nr:hypothetical protein [Aquidulcibacter sp.]